MNIKPYPQRNSRLPNRRSIRLSGYDYSRSGYYFVTICTKGHRFYFGDVINMEIEMNEAGKMVKKWYMELENKFPDIICGDHVIMPNHIHAIIQNTGTKPVGSDLCACPDKNEFVGADLCVCPHGQKGEHEGSPLHKITQWFKTMTTNNYILCVKRFGWTRFHEKLWQRNYFERIIRTEKELTEIRQYIANNPAKWRLDRENPINL